MSNKVIVIPPEQFKDNDAAYSLIDNYLKSLQDTEPDERATHLIEQQKAYKFIRLVLY